MPITVVPQPDADPPRVQITVTGYTGAATVTVLRNDPTGRSVAVRSADPANLTSGDWAGLDYEIPFGQPVTYTAVPSTGITVTSTPVTLTPADSWLIHPGVPDYSIPIPLDRLGGFDARTRPARSAVLQPLGRVSPIVVTDARGSLQSAMRVATETFPERDTMVGLLADGSPLLLNIPPALELGITYEWITVGDVAEDFFARGLSSSRIFTLPYTVVSAPVGSLTAQWLYSGVVAAYNTYSDAYTKYTSYADFLTNVTNDA